MSFNPLTGISSILTSVLLNHAWVGSYWFQSPDGDFVYSDAPYIRTPLTDAREFQSPDGDFVYSDALSSSPGRCSLEWFQSPDGDFVYSDTL